MLFFSIKLLHSISLVNILKVFSKWSNPCEMSPATINEASFLPGLHFEFEKPVQSSCSQHFSEKEASWDTLCILRVDDLRSNNRVVHILLRFIVEDDIRENVSSVVVLNFVWRWIVKKSRALDTRDPLTLLRNPIFIPCHHDLLQLQSTTTTIIITATTELSVHCSFRQITMILSIITTTTFTVWCSHHQHQCRWCNRWKITI